MGLFGNSYAKEGPGVDKNAPQKKRFFLFWDLYFRKFWKLVQVNLLYVIFWIPAAVGVYYLVFGGLNLVSLLLILLSVVLGGPANAGMTYVLRNFAREEHAFVFSDFRDKFKENFKQAAIYNVLYTAVMALIVIAAWFYFRNVPQNKFFYLPLILSLACFLVVNFMNFYMYTMIVTFRMGLRQMLKNAFIFSVLGIVTNIVTFLFTGAIVVLMVLFFPLTLLFVALIACSTVCFIATFNAYPRIEKYMIAPQQPHDEDEDEDGEEEERIFSDERLIPEDTDGGQ
ncbi:MAG: DUF624 domain-containing protein [Provencibacterium sp.]|nr:DUF624 domain-containing protein [Provencibacterium sp.]